MLRSRLAILSAVLVLAAVTTAVVHEPASACGSFFRPQLSNKRYASMAYEQVLIVHDAARNRQHFIREVAFRRAAEPFGFVVPTPSRPEVAKVARSPFTELRSRFPFDTLGEGLGAIGTIGYGGGTGTGSGYGGRGVEVLGTTKVGSFTAFVLAADDATALGGWLRDHDLATTPQSEAWLAEYVALKFHFVAMRYDPPKTAEADAPVAAETIRISFDTPVPFYPYREPALVAEADDAPRMMDLWVVGSAPVTPVALRQRDGKSEWIRPLRSGDRRDDGRDELAAVDEELARLLPEGPLVIQTFQDQKRTRPGIGDILFAAESPIAQTPEDRAALQPLLAVLDPAIGQKGGAR